MAAPWNPKARLWINGRRSQVIKPFLDDSEIRSPVIWVHCASLGEFEQGRPLIENLKKTYPACRIVLTFFSPSGYEIRKNYPLADQVLYLPMDGPAHARHFINTIQPDLVIWVKYEYWYYYLAELKKRNIPVLLVSGIFRESQPFFKWYGGLWKNMLGFFRHLFVQTKQSADLLQRAGINEPLTVSGDTRFDRVIDIAENFQPLPRQLLDFCNGQPVLVAGSTWEPDEAELTHYVKTHPGIRFIIAPHEVHEENIRHLAKAFPGSIRYSALMNGQQENNHSNVLIIDNIGMLARLYHCARVTYVGGGFGEDGIHNVLEAAVYGKPVIFGPEHEKFAEAVGLVRAGGAFSINNAIELEALLNKLFELPGFLEQSSIAARDFVYAHRGATQKIMDYIQENRLLIS